MPAVWPDRPAHRSLYGRIRVVAFRGVLFDWRGTLVVAPGFEEWAGEALRRLGRPAGPEAVGEVAVRLAQVADELDGPGIDTDAALHRRTYLRVLADLGLDAPLVTALYEVECDPAWNVFADDAVETVMALKGAGLRIAVVSDIHVDIRPAFAGAGLLDVVDVFTLSFEQGVQKPDPAMFTRTLTELGLAPAEALMVGDRSRPDGAAVELGIATLLLPPLERPSDRRLDHVAALCGAAGA
jgi:FMN phosphatase YigB (HAD superfamily)